MNDERVLILRMVADGKLSPDEADRLLAALDGEAPKSGDRRFAADVAYDLLSRTARDLQKGVRDLGTKAEDELRRAHEQIREREASLREQIESIARTIGKKAAGRSDERKQNTIHIGVEEEQASTKPGDGNSAQTGKSPASEHAEGSNDGHE